MNNKFNIIEIIKDSSVTNTIWKQELNRTEDKETLKILLDSYVEVAMIALGDEDVTYKMFYDMVLQKFEENYV